MRALLVLALLCWAAGAASAQTCRFPSFQTILAAQPGLTVITQIVKTLEASNPAAVPSPADGVTFLAPTDAAFIALLANSGLSTSVAQQTLAAKGVPILEYHLLSGGGYTLAQLVKAVTVQTDLGVSLKASLPLTFGAGTTAGTVTASGVADQGTLSAATPVCTSTLYVINSVLLPSRTLATVPAVTAAAAPATALAPALGPAADVATNPSGSAIAAAPKSAPVATIAPGLAPADTPLLPATAPGLVPAPSVAVAPAPATTSSAASSPSGSNSSSPSFALSPSTATPSGASAGAGASAVTILACSAAAAMALLAAV